MPRLLRLQLRLSAAAARHSFLLSPENTPKNCSFNIYFELLNQNKGGLGSSRGFHALERRRLPVVSRHWESRGNRGKRRPSSVFRRECKKVFLFLIIYPFFTAFPFQIAANEQQPPQAAATRSSFRVAETGNAELKASSQPQQHSN